MHTVIIPFALLAARECRISRQKYVLQARQYPSKSVEREIDMSIAKMYRQHEQSWMETYAQDCL